MSSHDSQLSLRQMLDHAREAVAFTHGKLRADLETDRLLELGIVRLLEVLGEAAGRIPGEERARHSDIPWSEIIGLRNRLIHAYDAVDLDIVWRIVTDDLPPLVAALDRILSAEPPNHPTTE